MIVVHLYFDHGHVNRPSQITKISSICFYLPLSLPQKYATSKRCKIIFELYSPPPPPPGSREDSLPLDRSSFISTCTTTENKFLRYIGNIFTNSESLFGPGICEKTQNFESTFDFLFHLRFLEEQLNTRRTK